MDKINACSFVFYEEQKIQMNSLSLFPGTNPFRFFQRDQWRNIYSPQRQLIFVMFSKLNQSGNGITFAVSSLKPMFCCVSNIFITFSE